MKVLFAQLSALGIILFARLITAVRGEWRGTEPAPGQRVYFANHASNGDFVLLWTVLPPSLRRLARPVAAADYWQSGPIRRFIINDVFRGVLIDRVRSEETPDPIEIMADAIDAGDSLIIFPEGTRNTTEERLLKFKSGIYRLAVERPELEFVPVWINNLNRVMPKGELLPVPLLCSVIFGEALKLKEGESKKGFLERARTCLLALSPDETGDES
jgi:1-acyl-sn-glycerol-3-phosphate acyltransferase